MPTRYLEYPLSQGYIHNWLVAGPQAVPVPQDRFEGEDLELQIAHHFFEEDSRIVEMPVDRASFALGDTQLSWAYHKCLDDHCVDLSAYYPTPHYLRSWAYARVKSPVPQEVAFVLTTHGPADLWVNGEHLRRQEQFSPQDPHTVAVQGSLNEGENEILVRFEQVAVRACSYAVALRIVAPELEGVGKKTSVRLPTGIRRVARRRLMEQVFEHAYLEEYVNCKGRQIMLRWGEDLTTKLNYACQIMDARQRAYLEALPEAASSESLDIGHYLGRLWERPYDVVLRARPFEYYEHNLRYERRMPLHVLDNPYSDALYGTFAGRRTEALEHAALRGQDVYAEIAKMALGQWDVDHDRIAETIAGIDQRADGSDVQLLGLLGAMHRYLGTPEFPEDLRPALEACVLNFKYWRDEPGSDAMCYQTESHSILFHTCEILAGQLYPDHTFTNAGQSGEWHHEKGEKLALGWLHTRGTTGFSEWDSNAAFERDLAALAHLVDFGHNEQVRELASVTMDKMLFTIALNSFKGVFGSTHGQTYAPMIRSGQLEATSGITRLLWGMGVWNHHAVGVVSMATSEYEMPLIIPDIAINLSEEMWNREQHPGVNKVTYRTPDYMLCSAQDYRPGQKGLREHIWQATMGPDAVVFVNHPACMSEADARHPNFWCGNVALPRVAQWKDVLIAVYKLPDTARDWLGFTHAHFPVYAFDECGLSDGWAFAHKGAGYLAITAAQGIELTTRGSSAYHELRSSGRENVWICFMGRSDTDGTFEEFREKVLSLDVNLEAWAARCTTLRGETVSFGWEGPLLVNGQEQPLAGFKHYDNPYCQADLPAPKMEILTKDFLLHLDFALE